MTEKAAELLKRPQKVGTPVADRSFVTGQVIRRAGDALPFGQTIDNGRRSPLRAQAFIESGGIKR